MTYGRNMMSMIDRVLKLFIQQVIFLRSIISSLLDTEERRVWNSENDHPSNFVSIYAVKNRKSAEGSDSNNNNSSNNNNDENNNYSNNNNNNNFPNNHFSNSISRHDDLSVVFD